MHFICIIWYIHKTRWTRFIQNEEKYFLKALHDNKTTVHYEEDDEEECLISDTEEFLQESKNKKK
jgi:hypothetical protein